MEYVITGGRFDAAVSQWMWRETAQPFGFSNWLGGGPSTPPPTPPSVEYEYCMEIVGELSTYGWASIRCTNPHLFICQFWI
jgi:hypothetical protein